MIDSTTIKRWQTALGKTNQETTRQHVKLEAAGGKARSKPTMKSLIGGEQLRLMLLPTQLLILPRFFLSSSPPSLLSLSFSFILDGSHRYNTPRFLPRFGACHFFLPSG
ncbi:unnamed protein product [Lactuca virosa]|uniref:Uncharacterized protein n=1 Tax=Lactuca virosa TaxID=75947 RepID=A0AAU9PPF2_9ASTR|nr:unnamed protein product [Lactuca virosa]